MKLNNEQILRLLNIPKLNINDVIKEVILTDDNEFVITTTTATRTIAIDLNLVEFVMNGINLKRNNYGHNTRA